MCMIWNQNFVDNQKCQSILFQVASTQHSQNSEYKVKIVVGVLFLNGTSEFSAIELRASRGALLPAWRHFFQNINLKYKKQKKTKQLLEWLYF